MIPPRRPTHSIGPTQQVVFFPTYGREVSGGWEISVHGALFRQGVDDYRKRIFLGLLRRVLKATHEDFSQPVFRARIEGFVSREQPGKRLAIQLGDQRFVFGKRTKRSGHVRVKLRLTSDELQRMCGTGAAEGDWLDFNAITQPEDQRQFPGRVQLLRREGVSVISDIDDTLKVTGVRQRKLMLANTFFNDFQPIAGMETVFQQWAAQGAAFHYVSSSPWQLYHPLQELFDDVGLPRGTFHLKAIRFRDPTILRLFIARRLPKRRAVAAIVRAFPQRKFILVGDSGEKDPEIYGMLARKFPAQILRIYVRNVAERPLGIARYEKAFRKLPEHLCQVFQTPKEIEPELELCQQPA